MTQKKPLILAIDDTPANLMTLGMALNREFDLQIATSGAMGLELATKVPPDLILLDIMMPDMDGFETLHQIKAIPVLQAIPVIFVSAVTEVESETYGLSLGAVDYITKPVNVEIARQRIRNLIERETLRKDVTNQRDLLATRVIELDQARQELMRTQATLTESEAHLRAIILNEPECIKTVDANGHLTSMNPAGLAMVEADSLEQVVGKPVLDIIAPEHRPAFESLHHKVLSGESVEMEFEVQGLRGRRRWLETHAVPLKVHDQVVQLAVTRDITERKNSELLLAQVLQEQKAMLENEMVGIVKVKNRIIVWANPGFEKMMGYDSGELTGVPTRQHYPSDKKYDELAEAAYPVMAAGSIFRDRLEFRRKSGETIWVDASGALLEHDGDESLWTMLDITDRKHAEETLMQQMRFEQALNEVAQAIIAHDDSSEILKVMATIVGQAMTLDRVLIYDVSFTQWVATGLCEWLNPTQPELTPTIGTYSLDIFKGGAKEIQRTHQYLISHIDAVDPHFADDGSAQLLHQHMKIQSLLWYPFNFGSDTCNFLALNQVYWRRSWTQQELDFLRSVSNQVSIALTKIRLLEAQKKAQEKIELAASVFTHAREGIIITKSDGAIVEVNDAFTRITGYSREETLGQNPRILKSGRQGEVFYANMWRQLTTKGHWYGEVWNRRKSGEDFAEMLTITAVKNALGNTEHFVALFSDITALKEHAEQLEHIAHYDALTNLPNRVLLADRLRQGILQEQRRKKVLAVVFLDLDGFKNINDTYGHEAGDQLLIALSSRMKLALREGDTLARIGGDEFVAVLGDLDDAASSVPMLARLLSAAAQPLTVHKQLLQVSASLGVTYYPQAQDVEADQLIRQADQAMYQAKLAGKNCYSFFDAEQDTGIRTFNESIERIRQGLNEHEFVMFYQPKVNMLTGAIIGAEALIRWQHSKEELLLPGNFLPAIENHPLAIELGEWVIDSAMAQMEVWQSQGLNIPVSVNVGARQLQQPNFVTRLQEILAAHPAVKPSSLEIEILETSALEDLARVSQVIEDCRKLGVMFAMDDFGTGYSSLTYLRRLRVNLLKIDQSFVRDMLDDTEDLTILLGVIGLAKSFRRLAIAEGVETIAHGTLLLQLGCELAQGYGIARPMPANDMLEWTASWKPDAAWCAQSTVATVDLPILYARIEHRCWIASMGAHLRGELPAPPPLDQHMCNFGKWLDGVGFERYGLLPNFAVLHQLHQQVHALGVELVTLQAQGCNAQAIAKFPELEILRDKLLEQLEQLSSNPSNLES